MQDLVFEMAPEIVSDEETELVNGRKVTRKRGKVEIHLVLSLFLDAKGFVNLPNTKVKKGVRDFLQLKFYFKRYMYWSVIYCVVF